MYIGMIGSLCCIYDIENQLSPNKKYINGLSIPILKIKKKQNNNNSNCISTGCHFVQLNIYCLGKQNLQVCKEVLKFSIFLGVPVVAQWLMNPTRNHEVAGSVPALAQWVNDPALP